MSAKSGDPYIVKSLVHASKILEAFDPPGVAARNIQECLLIQLKADPNPDPDYLRIRDERIFRFARTVRDDSSHIVRFR